MIDIQNVNKSFKGSPAIQDLTLQVKEGEILGLLGANGAGKSTTINMLLGFLAPDTGTVSVNQLDMTQKADQARKFVGYIPENVNLYPYLSGIENLDYFCRLAGIKYSKTELEDFLTTCGLENEAQHKKIADYSKGMRQKVDIAIAYAKKAKVYLLDEPASGLDPLASNELSELLKKLASEGATIAKISYLKQF
jgi:ABC-2 type transport system ATP-binding protein